MNTTEEVSAPQSGTTSLSAVEDADYEGYVDVVRWSPWRTSVVGWVRRRSLPEERVAGCVVLGAKIMGEFVSDRRRMDLLNSGVGDGEYGFRVDIDTPMSPEDAVHLRIVAGADHRCWLRTRSMSSLSR